MTTMDMEQVCDMAGGFRHQGIRATRMENVRMSLDISKDVCLWGISGQGGLALGMHTK